jgi:hypothetical protein
MRLLTIILILFTLNSYSQNVIEYQNKPSQCCQHLDEEFGETWTILYWAKDKLDAQRLIDRYKVFDIANNYFESTGEFYIELVDPSDTLETDSNFELFRPYHKQRLIYIDFLIDENNNVINDSEGNKLMFR